MKQFYLTSSFFLACAFLVLYALDIEFPGSTPVYLSILINNFIACVVIYRDPSG